MLPNRVIRIRMFAIGAVYWLFTSNNEVPKVDAGDANVESKITNVFLTATNVWVNGFRLQLTSASSILMQQ